MRLALLRRDRCVNTRVWRVRVITMHGASGFMLNAGCVAMLEPLEDLPHLVARSQE